MRYDPKQWATGQPYPPLATVGAAALMREHGYEVTLFDTMFVEDPDEVVELLRTDRPDFFVVYDDGFNYLTKMCLTNMREAAHRMIRLAREYGCTVIVSSSDSTDHYEDYLQKGADFVLMGEGEQTLLEVVEAVRRKEGAVRDVRETVGRGNVQDEVEDFSAIRGLAYLRGGVAAKTPARPVMRDLDVLPMPAWDLVDMDAYRAIHLEHHGYFSLNVSTTRGCPFKCNWCAKPIYGNRYNARSPRHVVQEIGWLKERYHFDHIWFCDDIFGLKPGWVNEFADLVEKEGLRFRFKIQSRADLLLQENYVAALARAGCENSWMGAESGSQKILDAMDKGTSVEQIQEATGLLREYGIRPSFFIQFGYPGETKEDIRKTIRMINRLLPDSLGISVSYPLPGTPFYERVKADLQHKANWTDSDELKIMFRNTYHPSFYKQLHRYVHLSYRWHLALRQIKRMLARPAAVTRDGIRQAASIVWYGPASLWGLMKLNKLEKL